MSLFTLKDFDDHEQVVHCSDPATGLRAIIAIHSTYRGPAAGGLRMFPYASEDAALTDALRLSRGMSYKNACADLPLGGGKAVIIGDPHTDKSPELFRAFGKFVERLGGRYYTAEDVGTSVADLTEVSATTRFVTGLASGTFASGDPSPFTAEGVFLALKAALQARFGSADPTGRRVLIQGLGHVGRALAGLLSDAGARLIVHDIDATRVAEAVAVLGATAVEGDLYSIECDVYAPCAMGATLDELTVSRLRATIVAGAANNQLATETIGRMLLARGILYAPDYIANAGGIINCAGEIVGSYDVGDVRAKIANSAALMADIFDRSARENRPTNEIANEIARDRIGRPAFPQSLAA